MMGRAKLFLKGIVVGLGGIVPGLSGSFLMVILGLYFKVIDSVANLFKNFKKNLIYLLPIGSGMILGIIIFSRVINYSMKYYEIQTRLLFFGILLGTIPLFFQEVKKKRNVKIIHYGMMAISFMAGLFF